MSLRRRLDRLERQQPAGACPDCGMSDDAHAPVQFHLVTSDPSSPFHVSEPPACDSCSTCGRAPAVFTIRIAYVDDDDVEELAWRR